MNSGTMRWLHPLQSQFEDLIGQQRLPHAILIDGAPGWGQSFAAARLAWSLLPDQQDTASASPDAVRNLAHPDLRWIDPDGAAIKVDRVREAIGFAASTAEAGSKVIVFDQAHCLGIASGNALLKTLEEPNPGTYVILATENANRLLPTIRSRVQRFSVVADAPAALDWLQQQGLEDASAALFEAGHAPLSAIGEEGEAVELIGPVLAQALSASPGPVPAPLLERPAADVLLRWLRYVSAELGNDGQMRGLKGAKKRSLLAFSRELIDLKQQVLASNSVNVRLQFERLLLLWRELAR